jgi:hypothetical protein
MLSKAASAVFVQVNSFALRWFGGKPGREVAAVGDIKRAKRGWALETSRAAK